MEIEKYLADLKDLEARILSEEARLTPMPVQTGDANRVLQHLRRTRDYLASARTSLRLAAVEAKAKPPSSSNDKK